MIKANGWLMGLALIVGASACEKKEEKSDAAAKDSGAATTGAATAKTTAAAAPAAGAGMDDPSNDKAVVALAKEAIKCEWDASWGLKSDCPAMDAFNKAEPVKSGKVDATLVNFTGDAKKEVRWLGASALSSSGTTFKQDPALAKKLVAAGRAEKDPGAGKQIGRTIAYIDVGKTGTADDIKKVIAESDNQPLRDAIVDSILFNNRTEGGFYDLLQQMARTEKNKDVRKTAAGAFWVGGSERHDDTCKLWLELVSDPDDDLASNAAYWTAFWSAGGGCQAQWDPLLDQVEKHAKDGTVKSSFMAVSLGYLYKQEKASDAQKKRALAIAHTLLENKSNSGMSRGDALRVIGENDPANAKSYAAKFENDSEFFVKNEAQKIKEGKK